MNQKNILLGLGLLFIGSLFAQSNQTIKVIVPNKSDEVYITGNQASLGNWEPGSIKMESTGDYEREITLDISYPAEFKFTKGDWNTEGITHTLDHNPNEQLVNAESKPIFVVKGWSNDTSAEALGLDYSIKHFRSDYLEAERLVKIVLPKNYNPSKTYPVFYTTDAGWNIFSVVKNTMSNLSLDEYKLMPESILVGIVHGMTKDRYNRNDDLDVYYKTSGKNFKNFIFKELVPYINNTYSTSGFNVMIGHSNGAEYNHYLLLEDDNPFRGFISFSTNFYGANVSEAMGDFMRQYQGKPLYYFVANATVDSPDRIEAGNTYETTYKANPNPKFQFKKTTYEADHNSVVPLALTDAIQFVFKDYRNFDNYSNFAAYRDRYLKDLEANYGIVESYDLRDLDPILEQILKRKNKADLDDYLQFVEDHKLWHNPYMSEPGGMDEVNTGNFYFFIEDYETSAANYAMACQKLGRGTMPRVYFGNFPKAIKAFYTIEDYKGLMQVLLDTKVYLQTYDELSPKSTASHLLFVNYHIAKLSKEHGLNVKEGKAALAYCKANYKANRSFTEKDLEQLQ